MAPKGWVHWALAPCGEYLKAALFAAPARGDGKAGVANFKGRHLAFVPKYARRATACLVTFGDIQALAVSRLMSFVKTLCWN